MRILFVENHDQFASVVIRAFLNKHEVTVVKNIASALDHFINNEYDVLLVDYDLDDGKGDRLVQSIRKDNLRVKIVAVSSHERGNEALLESGADAVCSKIEFSKIGDILESLTFPRS